MAELKLPVKQGEEFNVSFTIKQGDNAMDLTDYTVRFQVKKNPIAEAPAIIDKIITLDSDINDVGQINYPQQGIFTVHLLPEDTSIPLGEYSLIIFLESYHFADIISSKCCNKAIYKVCEQ